MIPVKQQYRHEPEKGIFGDCHRAALASLLEMPIESVPHFCDPSKYKDDKWVDAERTWLRAHGFNPISLFYETDDLSAVLFSTAYLCPDTFGILGGRSKNGTGHSVIICNGEIVHDPALDNSGIVGPMKDGRFWLTWIGHARAVKS